MCSPSRGAGEAIALATGGSGGSVTVGINQRQSLVALTVQQGRCSGYRGDQMGPVRHQSLGEQVSGSEEPCLQGNHFLVITKSLEDRHPSNTVLLGGGGGVTLHKRTQEGEIF